MEVVQLTAADWDEGLAFLNEVFGEYGERNFATLLPSIYQPTEDLMACNHAVREDGKIRAVVGMFPIQWQVGDVVLKVGGIGGVSTHRTVRGKGYMKLLMHHCVEKMQPQGYHLSWLGGQRQRYGYFGYEKCGQRLTVSLTSANVRHVFGDLEPLRFESIGSDDRASIDKARSLHDAQLVHCIRGGSELFSRFLANWYHRPYAALDATGRMVGYVVADESGGQVLELLADDPDTAVDIARSWVQSREGDGVSFDIPVTRFELLQKMSALGESASIGSSGNWQIYDWQATLAALLQARVAGGGLVDGDVVIGIKGYGNVRLQVQGSQTHCTKVNEPAVVTWDPSIAMRVFFGPLPPAAVTMVPASAASLLAWCPLPLGWPRQDGV